MKNIRIFYLKIIFLVVKLSVYLNRRVFVMTEFLSLTESEPTSQLFFGHVIFVLCYILCTICNKNKVNKDI